MRLAIRALIGTAVAAVALPAAAQMAPADYVKKAGASDKFEITEAKLMLGSKDAQVQHIANTMIADHTKSTAQVKAAAMKDKVAVAPPMLEPKQQAMVDKLKGTPAGAKRVALYLQQQKTSHEEALQVQQQEASSGSTPALRKAAAGIVPVVQMHIDMLSKAPAPAM